MVVHDLMDHPVVYVDLESEMDSLIYSTWA